jgi:RNA polymerase subunit RPABC4/transcription elongation factor Spt4
MKKKECPSCAMEVDAKSKTCPVCQYEFTQQGGTLKWVALLLALLFLYLLLL